MAKTLGLILGIVLIIVGILGYFDNKLVGDAGTFATNALHDWVHIISGIIIAGVALTGASVSKILKIFGVIYVVVAILGFVNVLGFLATNSADNWLHLVLGIVLFVIGMKGSSPAPVEQAQAM